MDSIIPTPRGEKAFCLARVFSNFHDQKYVNCADKTRRVLKTAIGNLEPKKFWCYQALLKARSNEDES